MSAQIKELESTDHRLWDSYVKNHPDGTLYHMSGWKNVIERSYRHKTYYLIAVKPEGSINPINPINSINSIVGILPLVHIKHVLFGNSLISIPYFDLGGILADDGKTEKDLLTEAIKLGRGLGADTIELRNTRPFKLTDQDHPFALDSILKGHAKRAPGQPDKEYEKYPCKVRMLLELPESAEVLLNSFKSKLRSQIRKPIKEGLTAKIGGIELLDDFYSIFAENMRDLGSPVHSITIIRSVLEFFSEQARIFIVYKGSQPLGCSVVVGFNKILENPWASSLRKYSRLAPNMLLYWKMIEYACENGFDVFDFGRSTPDEGTYKFKRQWGAQPVSLHWCHIPVQQDLQPAVVENRIYHFAVETWKRLPVFVTKIIGPGIRKYIGL
jgi:serine/alanine adding enzyme